MEISDVFCSVLLHNVYRVYGGKRDGRKYIGRKGGGKMGNKEKVFKVMGRNNC